jgi:uncharacterized protein YbbC (DUF1343 family)
MKFGIDRLLTEPNLRKPLAGKRLALLAHPASVTSDLTHSLDALAASPDIKLSAAFGPQHGLRGDKQDNMMESEDFIDPDLGIPVFSLYGEVRRPTESMMATFDIILIDLLPLCAMCWKRRRCIKSQCGYWIGLTRRVALLKGSL